jgi:uncharacterized protein (DUF488 family)
MEIWTIGHSIRSIEEFIGALQSYRIGLVADVRRFPGSRRNPQFGHEALRQSLGDSGIGYGHFPELGGRRRPRPDSQNTGWHSLAFRGYADYMETSEFHAGIDRLIKSARRRTAMMCAEAVWWHCHRALISDYLKIRGIEVILSTPQKPNCIRLPHLPESSMVGFPILAFHWDIKVGAYGEFRVSDSTCPTKAS